VPDLWFPAANGSLTAAAAAKRWLASRIDIAEATKTRHGLELARINRLLGSRAVDQLAPAEIADCVATLAESCSRETIRKTLQTLAMILDHEGINPNPARHKDVRLPREEQEEISPPSAEQLEAIYRLLPSRHELPFLFLDWSGARVAAMSTPSPSRNAQPACACCMFHVAIFRRIGVAAVTR
jgi:integrase